MAYIFGDGFDSYATNNDSVAGYWDGGDAGGGRTFVAGRFAGQAVTISAGTFVYFIKNSGANDAVHHIVCAFRQTQVLSGTTLGLFFQLSDGATNQVCIVFRTDGAILLTSATPNGTVLDTYTGAVSAQNVWFSFEFEVVINNTTGSWAVRKNGNTSNDRSLGSLNTRPGTNSYANRLQIGMQTGVSAHQIDDVLWRSDASSVAWIGDVRCYTRYPVSDVSAQFAKSPATQTLAPITAVGTSPTVNGTARYVPITPSYDGTIGTVTLAMSTGYTGNMKCTIFSSVANAPVAVLGSATPIVNPAIGVNTFTFGAPVSVARNVPYFVGFCPDSSSGNYTTNITNSFPTSTPTYAAFPVASPILGANQSALVITAIVTNTISSQMVNETLQDGTTSYVYDANVGDADLYSLAAGAGGTPGSVIAVTTRGFIQKGDAGSRSGAVQLKSGTAAVPTTWNPADKTTDCVLSNANLTATVGNFGQQGVRTIAGVGSGKLYWEYTFTNNTNDACGIINAATALSGVGMSGAVGTAIVSSNGGISVNNVSGAVLPGFSNGSICCVALDLTNQLIWFRNGAAGQWNGSGTANPATGVGGYAVTFVGAGVLAYGLMSSASAATGGAITGNFGASAFTGVVPAGFVSGFGLVGTTVQSPSTALAASFAWLWRTDTVDPSTGAAWTPAAVNALQIGPVVTA